jgi:hypothetical protein
MLKRENSTNVVWLAFPKTQSSELARTDRETDALGKGERVVPEPPQLK